MTELGYFEDLYRTDPDPWRLGTSSYETRKRALTVASLPRPGRYERGFEPACAGGELTALLAERCDRLWVSDPVETAIERVSARELPGVTVTRGALPDDWPESSLDLVVLSEILYFLDQEDRHDVSRRAAESLEPGGHLVAVHWRHAFDEAASLPEEAHADLPGPGLRRVVRHEEDDFRLEVFERA